MRTLSVLGFFLAVVGCGNGTGSSQCASNIETSCDVPNDNGAHTCYDVTGLNGDGGVQASNVVCTGTAHGTVLTSCCNHAGAIARCVFMATNGATSTEWFLSGSVSDAQSACSGKQGTFTTL